MTKSEYEFKKKEITNDKKMNSFMKKIALNDLYIRYSEYQENHEIGEDGFCNDDRKRLDKYKQSKIKEAIKLGLDPSSSKNMSLDQLIDFIVWKNGIDTRMDDSECTSDTSCE